MAETIESINRDHQGRRPKYPWDEWTDGQARRIKLGEDYECGDRSMISTIFKHAESRGLAVTTSNPSPGVVEFQFTSKDSK